ncbi:hypothetical protein FS837_000166 [Tulasnella sp. UAMH 9824]|nr:hypothetical protein FS837_000166 [Tulasnella sp. UAMH 9824]
MPQPHLINHVLPPEIFTSIFDILYDAAPLEAAPLVVPSEQQMASHFKCHPLLSAMLVCKAWYSLVESTPKYWTSIAIGVGGMVGWGSMLPQDDQGELLAKMLEEILKRSAQLPIQVTVVPELIPDLAIVTKALSPHTHRLSSLSLLGNEDRRRGPIHVDRLEDLLNTPFPALQRLVIWSLGLHPHADLLSESYDVKLTAPKLRQLACDLHFISPHSTSLLTHLSLAYVTWDDPYLGLPLGPVELPQLLELYMTYCHPDKILPTLLSPALQTLIVHKHERGRRLLPKPPQYANLRELQWCDVGQEECFDEILELSPNLTRYSNYVLGTEEEVDLSLDPATIFDIIGAIGGGRETNIGWPKLKEVYLDIAYGAGINELIQAFPSIEFLRILRDPIEAVMDEEKEEEAKFLEELGRKVAFKFGIDSM